MSRSAFAARFNELVGQPPSALRRALADDVALSSLKEDGPTLGELAMRLGYQSEAAFSRAFKRFIGVSPGSVRRNGDAANGQYAALAIA